MAPTQRKPLSGSAASDDGMKGLLDLFSRSPTPARVTMHVERLLAGWRDALDPDAYAERLCGHERTAITNCRVGRD